MLKIRDDIELKKLKEFGFRPKYDEDTGKIKKFIYEERKWRQNKREPDVYLRIEIAEKSNINKAEERFKTWWEITYIEHEFLDILYDLIQAGLVEKVK